MTIYVNTLIPSIKTLFSLLVFNFSLKLMPTHTLKKLLIFISIILNFVAIFGYIYGLIPTKYYTIGWLSIVSIGLLWLIQNWHPLGLRLGLSINTFLCLVAFIPVIGWAAIIFGIKLCVDDVMYLIDIFNNKMTPDQTINKTETGFEYSTKEVIDVEVVD